MTKEQTTEAAEPQNNEDMIQVAALLSVAAGNDPRMVPLAKQARKLVLDSEEAIDDLFNAYLASKQPPPTSQSTIGTQANHTAEALALVERATQLIKAKQ